MKTKDLLLEIGTEELPADYIMPALNEFKALFVKALKESRLQSVEYNEANITALATPRRLTLFVKDVLEKQDVCVKKVFGPPLKISKDKDGNWSGAALGFAKKNNIDVDKLEIKKDEKGIEKLYAEVNLEQKTIKDIISKIVNENINKISFPKQMRWIEDKGFKFARPLRWVLCFYEKDNLDISIENIDSGDITYGHRFLSKQKKIKIMSSDLDTYKKLLKENGVIASHKERREIIKEKISQIDILKKENVNIDKILEFGEELLDEIVFLTECPEPVLGSFDKKYLNLPSDVLITSMIHHQRYLPVFKDNKDNLLPYFISVRNIKGDENIIKKNNERVLTARLKDAEFFFKEDTKEPLLSKLDLLKDVVYHKDIGSYFDKTMSMLKLGMSLADYLNLSDEDRTLLKSAITISKIDLISNMVYEFPELQGKMGSIYAKSEGKPKEVCDAVYSQYNHCLSTTGALISNLLQMADRVDTLVSSFNISVKVSGSSDPYGLRRHVYAVIFLLDEGDYDINLIDLFEECRNKEKLIDFVCDRIKNYFIERKKYSYDIVDAVLCVCKEVLNIKDIKEKIQALVKIKKKPDFEKIMSLFARIINILKQAKQKNIDYSFFDENLLEEDPEIDLYQKYKSIKAKCFDSLDKNNYIDALNLIIELKKDIDLFFEKIMVMTENEKLRSCRLYLLDKISSIFINIADFSKMLIE